MIIDGTHSLPLRHLMGKDFTPLSFHSCVLLMIVIVMMVNMWSKVTPTLIKSGLKTKVKLTPMMDPKLQEELWSLLGTSRLTLKSLTDLVIGSKEDVNHQIQVPSKEDALNAYLFRSLITDNLYSMLPTWNILIWQKMEWSKQTLDRISIHQLSLLSLKDAPDVQNIWSVTIEEQSMVEQTLITVTAIDKTAMVMVFWREEIK